MLLYRDPISPVNYSAPDPEQSASMTVAHTQTGTAESTSPPSLFQPLMKVLPMTVFGPKGTMDIYVILDDGSTVTLIDFRKAESE